jgi:hypothetical protein
MVGGLDANIEAKQSFSIGETRRHETSSIETKDLTLNE